MMRTDERLAALRRHVGHTLRCVREKSGDPVAGYVIDTVALRCEDCGEVILEGVQRLLKKRAKR